MFVCIEEFLEQNPIDSGTVPQTRLQCMHIIYIHYDMNPLPYPPSPNFNPVFLQFTFFIQGCIFIPPDSHVTAEFAHMNGYWKAYDSDL